MSSNAIQIVQLESIEVLPSDCRINAKEAYHGSQTFQFKCTLCPLKFTNKPQFQSHVRDHFKPITCLECHKTFIGDKQYTYHRTHVHSGTKIADEPSENDDNEEDRLGTTVGTTEIEIKRESIEVDDDIEDVSFDVVESSATNVACDVCGRLFPNSVAVLRHRKTHSNEGKRFFCNVCNSGFNKKTNLEFHFRIHTNERPFKCDQCPKSFSHVSGERPYTCQFCPTSYAHSTDLRRHRRTHGLEEKRFTCDVCQKHFFENKFLKSHMRTHRNNASESGAQILHITEISKFDECSNEEYIDYEYIQSD